MPRQKQRVPVTMRALIQRINRILGKDREKLKTPRGEQARFELGQYYVLDLHRNCVLQKDVDPEELGRTLGVLKDYERVIE